jgi:hypothetical protein
MRLKKHLLFLTSLFTFNSLVMIPKSKSINNHPYKNLNIFNSNDYEMIVKRINSLSDTSKREWGTMTVTEMLAHCTIQLKMALFEFQGTKNEGSFIFRTSFGRWIGLYGPRWQKGTITPSQMKINTQTLTIKNFNDERIQLLNYLKLVATKDSFQEHPIFGELNKKDWGRLIWKHLDHHLRQFGG